ncbi:hypothetical protein [Nocardia sp. CDC160]|uniref:hypothetical protein n=1 Tax=Nocardia sp. CDC160 TaxID=3112166 RepID=UPI002DB5FAF3|nr:hypothetical protein [Nocardia sp. CDC160]MEC3920323.1 hypothetical protein [Nocardia sp. CDC160]
MVFGDDIVAAAMIDRLVPPDDHLQLYTGLPVHLSRDPIGGLPINVEPFRLWWRGHHSSAAAALGRRGSASRRRGRVGGGDAACVAHRHPCGPCHHDPTSPCHPRAHLTHPVCCRYHLRYMSTNLHDPMLTIPAEGAGRTPRPATDFVTAFPRRARSHAAANVLWAPLVREKSIYDLTKLGHGTARHFVT